MSVSNYIDNYNRKRDNIIQSNIEYSNNNPYPIDELNELGNSTVLKYVFDENGQIPSAQKRIKLLAIEDNKDLYDRLSNGARGLEKLKQNEKLLEIDPEAVLKSRFDEVVKVLNRTNSTTDGNIKLDEWLNGEITEGNFNTFGELYNAILESSNMTGIDADIEFVISAFKELSGSDETDEPTDDVNTLNDEDIIDEVIDGEDPLNLGETSETSDIVEGEITETAPELEPELTLTDDELDEDRGFTEIDEVSPINEEATVGDFDTNEDGTVSLSEYNENINSIINDIQENVTNETSNIDNQINEAINNNDRSYLDNINNETEGDVINNSSSITESNESSTTSSTGTGSGYFDDDIAPTSSRDLEILRSTLGMTSERETASESNDTINDSNRDGIEVVDDTINDSNRDGIEVVDDIINETSVNSDSPSIGTNNMSADTDTEETEVVRDRVGIDKFVAPINTPAIDRTNDETKPIGEEVKMTEVKSESNDAALPEKTETSITNNENNKSETVNPGYTFVDISQVEARLRKIENLLSSPLEVKIVD